VAYSREGRDFRFEFGLQMSRVAEGSASQAVKSAPPGARPMPERVAPSPFYSSATLPGGRETSVRVSVAARNKIGRLSHGRSTRHRPSATPNPGLDSTEKYPVAIAPLSYVKAKTAYIDGECGVRHVRYTFHLYRSEAMGQVDDRYF
jgi:hypothetical protein